MSSRMRGFSTKSGTGPLSGCTGCGALVILVGLALILVSVPVLVWNEGRAVSTYRTLIEGAGLVQSIRANTVDPAHDGQLVHLVGMATTDETLEDPELGVSAPAIKLHRKAEMYQWKETKHTKSNSDNSASETTYTYAKVWSESWIDSSDFYYARSYPNPGAMPYSSKTWTAATVSLGAYTLSASLVEKIDNFEPLAVDAVSTRVDRKMLLVQGGFYLGLDPATPAIGDVRIAYTQVTPTAVSVIAQATGDTFAPYQGKAGDTINLLEVGEHTAPQMFATAQEDNMIETWMLRAVGALLMLLGFQALNQPLAGLLRLIPFVGHAVQRGFGCIAAVVAAFIALPLSTGVIILSYVFFHLT